MSKRKCDSCGEMRDVDRAKICEKDHFICSKCHGSWRDTCPICKKKLK